MTLSGDGAATPRTTRRTRRRVLEIGGAAAAATLMVGGLLAVEWPWLVSRAASSPETTAATWAAGTLLVVVGLYMYTYANADEGVAPENAGTAESAAELPHAYNDLEVPTTVILVCGFLVTGVADIIDVTLHGSLSPSWGWAAAGGYGVAATLGALDGVLARRPDRVSRFGARLDTAVDAFGLFVAPFAGVLLGELTWWYLSVGAARYVFLVGRRLHERAGWPTFDPPPRTSRCILAGVQIVVVPLTLAPGIFDSWMPLVTGVAATAPLVGFARDWGYVSGRLGNEGGGNASVAE